MRKCFHVFFDILSPSGSEVCREALAVRMDKDAAARVLSAPPAWAFAGGSEVSLEERFERLALHLCSAFSDTGHWGVSLAAGEGSGCLGSGDGVFAYFPVVNVSIGIPSRGSLERNRSFAGDGFSVDAHFKDLSCQSADVSKMLLAAGFCKGEFVVAVVPFPSGCLGHSGVMASFHGSRDTDAPYVLAGVLSSVMDGLEMDGAVGQGGSLADSSARSA